MRRKSTILMAVAALLVTTWAVRAEQPETLKSVPSDFTTVDIRGFVNMGWADETAGDGKGGWTDQGDNDMANAPMGLRECRGIPFDIIDASKNEGKAVIVLKSKNFQNGLKSVTVPLKGARAETVYVLQAAAWLSGGAAKFTLVYEDGSRSKTLQAWENIRVCDWWSPADGGKYKVAFVTRNAVRDKVGMVAMEWENEHPDKPLKSLLIESYNKDTVMLVAAVTLSRKKGSAFTGTASPVAPVRAENSGSSGTAPRAESRFFYPPLSAHEDNRNWKQVSQRQALLTELAKRADAVDAIVENLLADVEQDEIYTRLQALAYLAEQGKSVDLVLVGKVFDKLTEKGDLQATLIAADLLLKTVAARGSWGSENDKLKSFPDALCDRAAALLEHEDPVVQATAEWTLSMRFRKQNQTTNRFPDLFSARDRQKPWFEKWRARGTERLLVDDYCRQLVQIDRHRSMDGMQTELGKIESRIASLFAAPGSNTDAAAGPQRRFEKALEAMRDAIARKDLLAAHKAYPELRLASREVIVACRPEFPTEGIAYQTQYRIPGGDWNVNMPVTNGTNMPGGDIYIKRGADPTTETLPFDLQEKIGGGSVRGIDLSWEADKIVFSYWNQPVNPESKPFGWDNTRNAHIYELDVATGAVRQLTESPGNNDIEPCYLPNGDVIFSSDRSSYGNQCAGPFIQDKRCTTLFRIDPRRSPEPVAISNNKDFDRFPSVLNDGTVVFMHWEYQERDLYNSHTAWRCRPDGTNMDAFYKQHIAYPMSIRGVQQVPDSQLCVATAQGHHDSHIGPVITFNPAQGINNEKSMQLVTPGVIAVEGGLGPLYTQVVPEGGVENRGGSYIDPFPMSEQAFLVGHDMEGLGGYRRSAGMTEYSIYYIDVWGNRELIHRDKDMSCFMPHPLRTRMRPPVVADTVDPDATHATAFVADVHRDLPGVQGKPVKYLRISQRLMLPAPVNEDDPNYRFNHLHWLPGDSTTMHFGYWTFAPTRTVGMVKVEEDGSAFFKVPAGIPVFLQALDENYCEVRRMRTSFTLQRGEQRGCTGCHESRLETMGSGMLYPAETLNKGPQTPVPPSWGDRTVLDYRRDIQPIFDKHCVKCHGKTEPKGGLDLNDRAVAGFTQSYRSLFGLGPDDPQPIRDLTLHMNIEPDARDDSYVTDAREARDAIKLMQQSMYPGQLINISDKNSRDADVTQPYQFGTNKSKLIRVLLDDTMHRTKVKAGMSEDEWLMLVTWIDHNANFHSTLMDKSDYNSQQTVTRVPYYLPDPWVPGDLNPTFYNKSDSSIVPEGIRGK